MVHIALFLFALLLSTSQASYNVNDFCIADLNRPDSPSGYHCKPPSNVTSEDFVFHGFVAGNTSNAAKVAFTPAFTPQFPAVNGLGLSVARIDMEQGGYVPMHTHPGGNEIVMMVEGTITVAFITPNAVYKNTLKPGDIMVIPQGNLHFLVNSGNGKAVAFAAYGSSNPRVHLLYILLFGNNLPTELVATTTFLDNMQVQKLKARFGGSSGSVTTNNLLT